ncbi:phage head spike fiber domain-containing protein, partial [Klebsiella oxytoca]
MATQIKSNKTYQGDAAALPSPQAPMPKLASLYLDFEKELYIALGRTTGNAIRSRRLADVVTFTRASETTRVNKSGLIEYLASGEAAIEYDPITGECLGLRVAAGVTNLAANSENFSGTTWTKSGVSTTAAKTIAPDGNVSASPFNESTDSADTVHFMQENSTPVATVGSPVTFSIFAKANTASVI